jgi:hypothetical protein
MGLVVHGTSCPWGELSVGRTVHGATWGELSVGRTVRGESCRGASCRGASCRGARCRGASCRGVSCRGASLDGASFDGASFDGASCLGTWITLSRTIHVIPHHTLFPHTPLPPHIHRFSLQARCYPLST